jgi:ribonuclease HI
MPAVISYSSLRKWLTSNATLVHTFYKGAKILAQKNAWRQASYKTRTTSRKWLLWAPKRYSFPALNLALQQERFQLDTLILTTGGTLPVRAHTEEEHLYAQHAVYYNLRDANVAATDGSLLVDGRMGAAVTFLGNHPAEVREGVAGDPSSTTAELVALRLAVEHCPRNGRDLIILTDSHNAITELEHCRRTVFRRPKTPRESLHPLQSLVTAINDLTENGQEVNILKVRAHSGHPLNERADEIAAQAAAHLDPPLYQSPTLHCRFRYRRLPVPERAADTEERSTGRVAGAGTSHSYSCHPPASCT